MYQLISRLEAVESLRRDAAFAFNSGQLPADVDARTEQILHALDALIAWSPATCVGDLAVKLRRLEAMNLDRQDDEIGPLLRTSLSYIETVAAEDDRDDH